MPRRPRLFLPNVSCHIVQRGNNRDATFYCDDDYQYYLYCLGLAVKRFKVELHAYVLMTNHVHLLVTPKDEYGVSRMMQSVGRNYVQYINKTYRRTGTLWEGRFKSSLVANDAYLLACYRYIELNPVRAGMVAQPIDYRWSSYSVNACDSKKDMITPHALYLELGATESERRQCYTSLFERDIEQQVIRDIRSTSAFCKPLGNGRFQQQIALAMKAKMGMVKV